MKNVGQRWLVVREIAPQKWYGACFLAGMLMWLVGEFLSAKWLSTFGLSFMFGGGLMLADRALRWSDK
jgi:hypothetical protein